MTSIAALPSPLNGTQIAARLAGATLALRDNKVTIVGNADTTKVLAFTLAGNTTGKTLTLAPQQTTNQQLNFPNITATDTLVTLGLAQTFSGAKTFSAVTPFTNTTPASSSLTGAIVIGDQSTAATNVGIGGGIVMAGGQLIAKRGTSSASAIVIDSTSAGLVLGMAFNDNGTSKWFLYKTGGGSLSWQDATNSVDMLSFTPGTTSAGFMNFNNTTVSTSTGTGAAVFAGGVGIAGQITFDGSTGKSLRVTNSVANAAVAVTLGSVGPTGSTAGNPQGWLRVSVAGTDRFIPFW